MGNHLISFFLTLWLLFISVTLYAVEDMRSFSVDYIKRQYSQMLLKTYDHVTKENVHVTLKNPAVLKNLITCMFLYLFRFNINNSKHKAYNQFNKIGDRIFSIILKK